MRGKRVFVTGGTSGIGLALAQEMARRGAHVWIGGRTEAELPGALAKIRTSAPNPDQKIGGVAIDIADRIAVEAIREEVLAGLGGLDLLINNAGVATVARLEETTPDDYERMIAVNCLGTVWVTRTFLPTLIARKCGAICCVASTLGLMGLCGYSAYAASKFAVVGYAECLRQDLLRHGVSVHIAFPADVDTPQYRGNLAHKPPETSYLASTASLLTPEEVADAILSGIDRGEVQIPIGRSNRALIWLNRVFPGLVRSYVDRTLRGFWTSCAMVQP